MEPGPGLDTDIVPRHAFAPELYPSLLRDKHDRTRAVFGHHLRADTPTEVPIEVFAR